jgi:hypothetical protein
VSGPNPQPLFTMEGIEVDPSVLDHTDDSDYLSSGYDTSTASLTSSIHSCIFENGRRYHAYFGADRNLFPVVHVLYRIWVSYPDAPNKVTQNLSKDTQIWVPRRPWQSYSVEYGYVAPDRLMLLNRICVS